MSAAAYALTLAEVGVKTMVCTAMAFSPDPTSTGRLVPPVKPAPISGSSSSMELNIRSTVHGRNSVYGLAGSL